MEWLFSSVRRGGLLGFLVLLVMSSAPTTAVTSPIDGSDPPAVTRRLIHRFDFEDIQKADWSHVFEQAHGLPPQDRFFTANVDDLRRSDGDWSLRIDILGGSVSYRTRPEVVLPASVDSRFHFAGDVRTTGLDNAAARLEVRLVDGDLLDRSHEAGMSDAVESATVERFVSEPVRTAGDWTNLVVDVDTSSPECRAVGEDLRFVVAMQVVQPGFDEKSAGGRPAGRTPRIEDVSGTVWFDGLAIWQLPWIDFGTVADAGIVRLPAPVDLRIAIDDPIDPVPSVTLEIHDLDDTLVDRRSIRALSSGRPVVASVRPDRPGWYRAKILVEGGGGAATERTLNFLVLPEKRERRRNGTPRLGYAMSDWRVADLPRIADVLDELNPGIVEFSIWPAGNDGIGSTDAIASLKSTLSRQRSNYREPVLAIERIHGGLAEAARIAPTEVRAAVLGDDSLVRDSLESWFDRFGTIVDRWRIPGTVRSAGEPVALRELMQVLIADPVLSVDRTPGGWAPTWADEPYVLATEDLSAAAMTGLFSDADGVSGSIRIAPPPVAWRPRDRVDAMARRLLAAWRGGAGQLILPWNANRGPDPAMLAWTGLAPAIAGRRFGGVVPTNSTAHCWIATDGRTAEFVVWSDRLDETEVVRLPVGVDRVELVDLGGVVRPVMATGGMLDLEVGSTPIRVRGISRLAADLVAGLHFERSGVDLAAGPGTVELIVENPRDVAMEGRLAIEAPRGWSIEPREPRIRAAAGESARIPIEIRWATPPVPGEIRIPVRFAIESEERIGVDVDLPLRIRNDVLEIRTDWALTTSAVDGRQGVVVSAEVINHGVRPLDLQLEAVAWHTGRERRPISSLAPGERAVRRFHFKRSLERLAGTDIRVVITEIGGPLGVTTLIPVSGGSRVLDTALVGE
ncbi:MAG: hypothetical protein CMJ27_09485 [Phycisphaerae bacterium]|nr:hypothetical protein [Phycisphaerae bacterium]OUX00967.1 MAG: hypothetical protein CBD91_05675 [Phycisphaeraceae bacterium TMED231]